MLRDVGKHFSVNTMLAKESVATRLADNGISYTEFSYMILQAYDYLELYRSAACQLQIGGADQWGNITAGLDLIRRVEGRGGAVAHALTVPLVVKSDGAKFGKTAGGAIWLDATMTSPYAFYQFWLNTDDRDVVRFLRLFSLRSPAEIEEIVSAWADRRASRSAQRDGEPLPTVIELLVATGLCESKGAARRAVQEGGAYLDNVRVLDPDTVPQATLAGGWVLLRKGKRNLAGVRLPAGS